MPSVISMLKLEELSLVDNPANPLAMAPLYKRNSQEGEIMTDKVEIEKAALEEIQEKLERLEKEAPMLRAALLENGFVIKADTIEKKVVEEFITVEGEQINKADVPVAILKKMEADDAEKREMAIVKKAEETLPNLKTEHAVALIKKFDGDEEMADFLAAIDTLFANQMEEVGKKEVDADMSDPTEKMDALVKAYMAENKMAKKDYAKAYAAIAKTDEGKSLITKSYKGDS